MEKQLLQMKEELAKSPIIYDTSYEELFTEYELMTGKDFIMVLDLETSGLPKKNGFEYYHYDQVEKYETSRIVQISWKIVKKDGSRLVLRDFIIRPHDFVIGKESTLIHGIDMKYAKDKGTSIGYVLKKLHSDLGNVKHIISYNSLFILNVLQSELYRYKFNNTIEKLQSKVNICLNKTLQKETGRYMDLCSAHQWAFGTKINLHNSKEDVENIAKIFFDMKGKVKTYTKILF